MTVNYVVEVESFGRYAEANGVKASERALWLALFQAVNARAAGREWPEGYVEIKCRVLVAASGLSKRTVLRARERLAERGLIDFTIGGGEQASAYKLKFFSVSHDLPVDNFSTVAQNGTGGCQFGTGSCQNDTGLLCTDKDISVNYNINQNKDEDDIYINNNTARARALKYADAIGDAYRQHIGRAATPAEAEAIDEVADWIDAEGGLVVEAIHRAASASYPSKYAIKCLMSWCDVGLKSARELEVYEEYKRLSGMSRPDIAQTGRERLKAFLRDIKIKHERGSATV